VLGFERVEEAKAALLPAVLQHLSNLLVAQAARVEVVDLEGHPQPRVARSLPDVVVVRFDVCVLLLAERAIPRGDGVVRRALEDGEVLGGAARLGDELDAGRPGADDADAFPSEVHAALGPAGRVVPLARVLLEPLEVGSHRPRETAHRADEKARRDRLAVRPLDRPRARVVVPRRARHLRLELDVPTQVQPVRGEVQVLQYLRLFGVAFGPLPLLVQVLVEGVTVDVALAVTPGAGVAVPVPRPADLRTLLEHADREAPLAKPVQHVEPREPGSDDDDVDVGGSLAPVCVPVRHARSLGVDSPIRG
jgi:hypothetical protein